MCFNILFSETHNQNYACVFVLCVTRSSCKSVTNTIKQWCTHIILVCIFFVISHNAEVPYSNEQVNVIAIIFKKKRKLPTKKAATLFIKQW